LFIIRPEQKAWGTRWPNSFGGETKAKQKHGKMVDI